SVRRGPRCFRAGISTAAPATLRCQPILVVPDPLHQSRPHDFTNDSQDRFGVSHLAYLNILVLRPPVSLRHVNGFPSSDYYGDSVAMRLASGRRSRVPLVLNVSSVT